MHLHSHITVIMEKTSESTNDPTITKISLDLSNLTWEEKQQHWALFDNFSLGQTQEDLDVLKEKPWMIFVITLYSIIILAGFLENIIVVCVLLKNKHLHTPTNIFIIGLALSDISMCVFNLPFQLHYQLTDKWAFGETLCHVINPTFGIPLFVSSMTILMIAIERFMLIVHPFQKKISKVSAICIVISIGIFSVLPSIPSIIYTDYIEINEPAIRLHHIYCIEEWIQNYKFRHAYTVIIIFIQFFIPLIITSLLYALIMHVLVKRPKKKNERRHSSRTNKILIAIVVLFSVCWLPWNLFALILEFKPRLFSGRYIKLIDVLLKIFAMGSACTNPFLYGWLNGNFRKGLGTMVKGRQGRNRIQSNGYTNTQAEPSRTVMADKVTTAL